MTLPSDEERVRQWFATSEHVNLVSHEGIAEGAALLRQVRAEASQEKDAEIERLKKELDFWRNEHAGVVHERNAAWDCRNDAEAAAIEARAQEDLSHRRREAAEAERDALREENARLRSVATEVTGKLADSEIEKASLRDALTKEHGYSHGSANPTEWDRTDCDVCAFLAEPTPEKK